MKTWMCLICGWIYDEEAGDPESGIAPGTRWEDVPVNWTCPECGAQHPPPVPPTYVPAAVTAGGPWALLAAVLQRIGNALHRLARRL